MRTINYTKRYSWLTFPDEIKTEKQKDFYISLYKRLKHDRSKVDVEILKLSCLKYCDYESCEKMIAINKAVKLYGWISKQDRALKRLYRFADKIGLRIDENEREKRLEFLSDEAEEYFCH